MHSDFLKEYKHDKNIFLCCLNTLVKVLVEQNFFFPDGFHMTSPRICSNVIDLSNCPPLGQSLWWGDWVPPHLGPSHTLCFWAHELRKGHFFKQETKVLFPGKNKTKQNYYFQDGRWNEITTEFDLWRGPYRIGEMRNAETGVKWEEMN